jgi:membrane-bound metal-dependent hydrolase YbcI (DUF457 family)
MDTITHAFAGALLGKGLFTTRRSESPTEHSQQSGVAIFAVTVASAFPDIDVFYNNFAQDNLGMLKYHRYVTHSIIMIPIWLLFLTPLIRWGARMFGFTPPSFLWTALAGAVGIASHILLDLVTSFGTMIWSPLSRVRPAWDIIFIVDFIMSAILLVPQMAAWVHRDPERSVRRASRMWALFTLLALGVLWFSATNGYPFSVWVVPIASAVFAAFFFLPLIGSRGAKISRSTWARGGLLAATAYLLLCTFAHHVALTRLRNFATAEKINVINLAALPEAPSLLYWDGLILAPNGVYRLNETLLSSNTVNVDFFPSSPQDPALADAFALPDVQTYLWFARFPVTKERRIGGNTLVEISDIRFKLRSQGTVPSFAYRVTFDPTGKVIKQGMGRRGQ